MNTASTVRAHTFRPQLLERRARLQAVSSSVTPEYLQDLLAEIDAALERMDSGSYGMCESCHDTIETRPAGVQSAGPVLPGPPQPG